MAHSNAVEGRGCYIIYSYNSLYILLKCHFYLKFSLHDVDLLPLLLSRSLSKRRTLHNTL